MESFFRTFLFLVLLNSVIKAQQWQPPIITSFDQGVTYGHINGLKNWGDTAIVVTGGFNNIDNIPFDDIAKWNKQNWTGVGNNGTGGGENVWKYMIISFSWVEILSI